ncbi:metal-dependent hydrolase [Natrarchaeobius chitinivorans]|uniref:Metal-dependent hydrolase n=1 Tax=Natrarchaeobius chitinivorans TaxID=1679083 RepID=A0A3N6LNU5_NATCH|nr:metal-dependent hydrolase [Natrarchaeobius chitinivorans]
MFPLGHLAFAYLCFIAYAALTRRHLPARWPLLPLAIGSQLPDVIDKPLAYYGVLSSGRSAGHSIVVAVLLIGLVSWGARKIQRRDPVHPWIAQLSAVTPAAFAIGYLSHLVGDSIGPLLAGNHSGLSFLFWPFLPGPQYSGDSVAPWVRLLEVYLQPHTHPELPLIAVGVFVFVSLRVWHALGSQSTGD